MFPKMFVCASFLVLAACAAAPASITLDGPSQVTVYDANPVPLPPTQVLDASGAAFTGTATIAWAAEPATVATISADGATVTPVGEGTATITATTDKVSASYELKVAFPDAIQIVGLEEQATLPVGAALRLQAEVVNEGSAIPELTATWTTSDGAVASMADGVLTALVPGTASIVATWGALTDQVAVTVVAEQVAGVDPAAAPPVVQ